MTENRPKPLVNVGERPILWHIMKLYSHYGVRRFVLCLGYKGEAIVDYFDNYHHYNQDFTMSVGDRDRKTFHTVKGGEDVDVQEWEVTFVRTGELTQTGGRIKRIAPYVDGNRFFCTYGDGLSNVDLQHLLAFHDASGKSATLTAVSLPTTFGIVETDGSGKITSFREKPVLPGMINGGYFVFEREIFNYIEGDEIVLEDKPFRSLIETGQLGAFRFEGFWHSMDTFKDYQALNEMWRSGSAPWKVW